MYYKSELQYLTRVLESMHLQVTMIDRGEKMSYLQDYGLRRFLGRSDGYERAVLEASGLLRENTIYKLTDEYRCNYLFLLLPGSIESIPMLIGPYMSFELTRQQLLEDAERFGVPAWNISQFEACFASIPVVKDESGLFSMINVFGEILWGGKNAFKIIDVNRELTEPSASVKNEGEEESPEELMVRMQMMETRYAYENELMENVRNGHSQRASRMLSGFSRLAFEQRTADPVRNMKNYGIICNTLLRKAAEQGGVHPIFLDRISSEFARRIESVMTLEDGQRLMDEMAHGYCRLVRKNTTGKYSPVVHKAVTYIEADLSSDLSLSALSAVQNVSAGYLSTLFRKETGKTLTEYVSEKRMAAAARLLSTTRLQVQTVAQHCGMSDVNYFSKMFKKHYGKTPKQYREETKSIAERSRTLPG